MVSQLRLHVGDVVAYSLKQRSNEVTMDERRFDNEPRFCFIFAFLRSLSRVTSRRVEVSAR
jgi:hypothetical protein